MKHFFLNCWLEHKWLLILGGWGGGGAHRWVARGSNWAKSRLRSQLLKKWQKWKIMIFLQKTIALQLVSTKKLDADRNKGPEMAKFGTKIFCTCIGPTDTFSLAYNFWDICARTMKMVSFEIKFVVDYKTCVIFYNPPINQDIVVSQTTSKMHTYMGMTNTFSLAYNFLDIGARTMKMVVFKRKFVVDYKTCVIFYNPTSN